MTEILKVKCPRCRKKVAYEGNPYRPFCSDRCQLIDLGNWADGKYAVPDNHSEPDLLSEETETDGDDTPDESA